MKAELAVSRLDVEAISQGHRLAVQAHSRDLQRLEAMKQMNEEEKKRVEQRISEMQEKMRNAETKQ